MEVGICILFLMILCHIIDDFVLQPVCLSNLKQKDWWIKNGYVDNKYKYDYLAALAIHALSWSIMIHLPLMLLYMLFDGTLIITILLNAGIHFFVDHMKANKHKINLITDQSIHIVQVILTYIFYAYD